MNKLIGKIMLNHEQVRNFVYEYIDDQLNFFVKYRFEMHIKLCENCREYVDLYSSAANPGDFLKENDIPQEFQDKTYEFLVTEGVFNKDENSPKR